MLEDPAKLSIWHSDRTEQKVSEINVISEYEGKIVMVHGFLRCAGYLDSCNRMERFVNS